jgi:CelD/BcsL family acetyltransferase involved in cellulose biosynthesis
MMPQTETHPAQPGLRPTWSRAEYRLKFSAGGLLLFVVRFPAMVAQAFNLGATECDYEPLLTDDIRAAIVYSQPAEQPLSRVRLQRDVIRYVRSQYRRFLIALNGTYAEYEKRFSSRRRKHFHQAVRKLRSASGGAIDWREYRWPADIQAFHTLARQVSQTTYQERLVDAGLPDTDAFRSQLAETAERDGVRGYILFLDREPIAYEYCPVSGAVITCERLGYDPDYRQYSPGLVLLLLTLGRLFETKQFEIFDLGRGEAWYKETLATGSVLCADIYWFRKTISNLALVLCHATFELLSTTLSSISERLGVRQKLKRIVRSHYGRT